MSKSIANRRVFQFAIVLIFFLGGMSYNGWSQCQLHCPDDVTATCEESGPDFTGYALLTPCSGFGMFYDEMEYTGDCGYIIHRHWYYPGLGNCEQLITVVDTASPEFVNVPPDYALDCNEVLPEPTACLATDACDDQLDYHFFAGGTEGTDAECTVTAAVGPGPDWAFWLPGMVPGVTNWQFSDNASFVEYADGTAHLTGTIYNPANPSQSFEADIWLENGMNWTDWSALGRSYKDDLNLAGDLYTTWMYYELANGFAVLNGSGSLTGSQVWLHHFPFDYYYGFQCGEAANNKNSNYGLSGWLAYEGVVNGVEVEGEGDINLDKDCVDTGGCASTVAYYIWRAEDDCGHVSFATQHITITDTTAPVVVLIDSPIEAPCDALPEPAIEVTDDCSNVFIEVSDEVSIAGCPGQIIRTYTITDACGNATTASQVINLIPDDGPFFVNFPENLVLECSPDIDIPAADVQFEGACSNPSLNISEEVIPGECGGEYQIIRTYTLTDDCGNVVQQTWTIDVVDTTPPTLVNIPEGIELQCGESLPDAFVFAVDNCDSDPVVGVSASTQQLECGFAFIRTWFAVDDCGNTTELTEQVVVNDDVAPYFTSVPSDIEWPCDQPLPESTAAAADDCSLVSVTYSDVSTGEGCETVIVRTFTATDGCGNATTAVQHISLFDNLAPVISEVPGDATISCGDAIPEGNVVVTDNCDQLPEVSVSEVVVQADCGYTIVRTWTAIDACGNSASASQEIVVTDNQAPVFTYIPADAFYPCNAFVPLLMAEASDACSMVTVTYSDDSAELGCAGGIVRTFTATDGCGNSTSVSVNITYVDEEAPVFTVFPEDVVALCQDVITVDDVEIAYADNCSDVNLAYSLETQAGNCAASYTQYHTWTITDACGNSTTATWVVEVVDHEPPVFIGVPADITLECGDALPGAEVTATDNCLGAVEVEFSESIEPLACGYNHIRTWTATDACGNIGIATQVVTFLDTTNPYFLSYPENITVECGQPVPGPTIPVAYDECDGPVATIVTSEVYPGECPNTYTTEYIFRAFDGCGNYALWVQYISVVDTQGPQFDPFEPEVFLPCTAYNGVLVTATDNCSSTNIVFSDNVIQSGCDGLIERTYTATDACGNSNFAVQVIHIVDELAPVIQSFPEDVTVPCDAVPAVEEAEVQYTDNCSNVNISFTESYVPGDCPNTYTLLRTWNLSDACGNSTIAVWTVNVYDDAAPVLYGVPDDIELECGEEVPDALVFAIDACSGPSEIGLTAETVSDGCNELFIRTWMTVDDCGNYVEASQTVTFADYTAPVLSETPADIEVPCGESIPDAPVITATDNCDGAVEVILTESNAGTDKQPLLLRTWCSEDCSGNSTCWTQTIYLCAGDVNPPAMPGPDGTADDVVQDVKIFNSAGLLVMSFRTPLSKVQVIRSLQEGEYQLAPGIYTLCMGSEKPFNISQFAIVK